METQKRSSPANKLVFYRREKQKKAKPAPLIAYDFETTRIASGTPRPLYLTAYGLSPELHLETPIRDMNHLRMVIQNNFLTIENSGVKFVAWNANNYDAYFVAAALVSDPTYTIRPYLTRSKALRGMRVLLSKFVLADGTYLKDAPHWEFVDGIAMLGLAGTPLVKFLANFAPNFQKMTGVINFETEEFDVSNPTHTAYAMRDSEGLYHGMVKAQNILLENFNQPLAVTMGGACIKIFESNIPRDVYVYPPEDELELIIRTSAMRGGYCFCVDQYHGPVWKYDLNQAYAAAMREAQLPAGNSTHNPHGIHKGAKVYIARITAKRKTNKIPFYYRGEINGRVKSIFANNVITDTWLTSIEVQQLRRERWTVAIHESWVWSETFNMREYVDKLETIRMTCEGGTNGPIGTMCKAVGNHSYGKTLESLEPIEYLLSAEQPDGFEPCYGDGFEPLSFLYERHIDPKDVKPKAYHQPQIGAFITSYVRMVVRRAALLRPDDWLYADTDCVVFKTDVTALLDIDSKRYGAWKIEETGTEFLIIAKKVYFNLETKKGSAKGLHVKKLTADDFQKWFDGTPPQQDQTQRQNFLKVMQGAEMFKTQKRTGTKIKK